MSKQKDKITAGLIEIGACWAATSEKCILPNDGYDARPSYHIHPDASYPHENDIEKYTSLSQLEGYVDACKRAQNVSDENAWDIMQSFYASIQ